MKAINFQRNVCLKQHCTLGIGGLADFYIEIRTIQEMQEAIKQCALHKLDFFVLGKGSNCLFDDRGFKGVILHNKIDFFEHKDNTFHVGAGYSFSLLGTQSAKLGFGGLEFASGIPASVGGAVYMNAGANKAETADWLICIDFVDEMGKLHHFTKADLHFAYRSSPFQKLKGAVVGATFSLAFSQLARVKQLEIIKQRQTTQPTKEKSAGCIFKNPEGTFAGKLIDSCGLKGFRQGGAQVSEKHANFLINVNGASSNDFLMLINHIKKEIEAKTGIRLQSEVCYVPSQRISS